MPNIGNHVDAVFIPESVNTSTTLRINGGDLRLDDGKKALFGQGEDLQIYHNGDHSYIDDAGVGNLHLRSGTLSIQNLAGTKTSAVFNSGGAQELRFDNSTKLETTNTGVTITGTIAATTFSGSNLSTGASGTGVNISTNTISGPATLTIDPAAVGDNTGTVEIKGNLTVQGTTTTINSTTVDLDHLSLGDAERANFGDGDDLQIYHTGSASLVRHNGVGHLFITNATNDEDVIINSDDGSGGTCTYLRADGSTGEAILYHYGTEKLTTKSTGVTVAGTVAADGVSLGDDEKIIFGDNEDLRIFHDNSGSQNLINSFTSVPLVIMSNGDTSIKSNNGDKMGVFKKNAGVELYFDDNKKIETTNTGVTVTGAIEVSAATNITVGGTALPSLTNLLGGSLRGALGAATMHMTSSDPGSPVQGQFYFNSLDQKAKIYTGSSFVDLVPSGGGGGGGGGGSSSDANATFRKYTYSISSTTNSVTGSSDAVVTPGNFVIGLRYTIKTIGNTNFTAIGADASPAVGEVFIATGAGTSGETGEAYDTLIYSTGGDQNVEVYVNGVKAVEGASNDYIATNGSSVNFVANLASGDVVDVQVYELLTNDAFVLASGGTFSGNVGINTSTINNRLHIHSSGNDEGILLTQQGSNYNGIIVSADRNAIDNFILNLQANWGGNGVARIAMETGDDLTNKDDGRIKFSTSPNGSNPLVRMHIAPSGNVGIGLAENTNATAKLEVKGSGDFSGTHHQYLYAQGCSMLVKGAESSLDLIGSDSGSHSSSILFRNATEGFAFVNNPNDSSLQLKSFTTAANGFYVHGAGVGLAANSLVDIITVTKTGNVGIGLTSPGALLHLESTAANAARLRIGFDSPRYYDIFRGSTTNSGYLNFYGSQSSYVGYIFDGVDGEFMRINTSGNVGIGTNNPTRTLHIKAGATDTAMLIESTDGDVQINFKDGDSTSGVSIGCDNQDFYVRSGLTTERFRIKSNGLVDVSGGIQISENVTPTTGAGLELFREGGGAGQIQAYDRGNTTWLPFIVKGSTQSFHASGLERLSISSTGVKQIKNGNLNINSTYIDFSGNVSTPQTGAAIFRPAADTLAVSLNNVEKLRITSAGNVGIGTDTPTSDGGTTLEVYDSTTPTLRLNDGGDYKALFQLRGNDLEIRGSNGLMEFYTGNVDGASSTIRMVIENNGNVGIGTNNPASKLDVNGVVRIHQRTASVPARLCFKSAASNQSPTARIEFWEGNSIGNSTDAHAAIEYDGGTTHGGDGTLLIKGYTTAADQILAGFSRSGTTFTTGPFKSGGRVFVGNSTNGGFDYNSTADTLEFLTTNGTTHSELTSTAYVPNTNAGKDLGHHTKRWDSIYCTGVAFDGNPDAAATLLDDYEEGTYSASITMGGSGTVTMNSSYDTLSYTKIGRMVYVTGQIRVSSVSSPVGGTIINLPFTVRNNISDARGGGTVTLYITGQSHYYWPLVYQIAESTSKINITHNASGYFLPQAASEYAISIMYIT